MNQICWANELGWSAIVGAFIGFSVGFSCFCKHEIDSNTHLDQIGHWHKIGMLKVTSVEQTKAFWESLPVEAKQDHDFFHVGREAFVRFDVQGLPQNNLIVESPEVMFYAAEGAESERYVSKGLCAAITLDTTGFNSQDRCRSESGEAAYTSRVLSNEVIPTSKFGFKQEITVESSLRDLKTQQITKFMNKHVFKFVWNRRSTVHVKISEYLSGMDGKPWKTMHVEGDLAQ